MDCSFRNNVCVEPVAEVDGVDVVTVSKKCISISLNSLKIHRTGLLTILNHYTLS